MYQLKELDIQWHNSIYYVHKKGDFVMEHSHEFYEFILYKNGEGRTNCDVLEYPYKDSTLLIVPPNVNHAEVTHSTTETLCLQLELPSNVTYPFSFVNSTAKTETYFSEIEKCIKLLCYKWFSDNPNELVDIAKLNGGSMKAEELSVRDLMLEFLLNVNLVAFSKDKYAYAENSVNYAKMFIARNFNRSINYQKLANSLGYSYSRFRYIFSQKAGITLKQFQLGVQFSKAKQLLTKTEYPIKKVSQNCGFSSDVRFVSEFKNKFKITPQQYRKLIASNLSNVGQVVNYNKSENE